MNFILLCNVCPVPNWFSWASGIASIFALFLFVFYFMKPRLTIESIYEKKQIIIKCLNESTFMQSILDVHCHIVVSTTENFGDVITQEIVRDYVPGINFKENFVFKTENTSDLNSHQYIKVRILALNKIGVKKLFTRKYRAEFSNGTYSLIRFKN